MSKKSTIYQILAVLAVLSHAVTATPIIIISEYFEGSGSNNKAIEITNIGTSPAFLNDISIEQINGSDDGLLSSSTRQTVLSSSASSTTTLDAGASYFICVNANELTCDKTFSQFGHNGDDSYAVYYNESGNGSKSNFASGDLVDIFGQSFDNPGKLWEDKTYRRLDSVTSGYTSHTAPFNVSIEWADISGNPADGLGCYGEAACQAPNTPPTISGTPATDTITIGDTFDFTPTASDDDSDPMTFAITVNGVAGVAAYPWLTFVEASGRLSGTSNNVETLTDIVITVNDDQGGSTSLPAFTLTVQGLGNSAPSINALPTTTVFEGQSLNLDLDSYISDVQSANSELTITASGASWAQTSGTTLTLTPANADIGAHTITISADDSELVTTETITVNVVPLVLITEYVEGSSYNKAIELSNLGSSSVDGSKITLNTYQNAETDVADAGSYALTDILPAGESVILYNSGANNTIKSLGPHETGGTGSVADITGNDTIVVYYDGIVIDSFGKIGENINWSNNSVDGKDNTLRRKATTTSGDIDATDSVDLSVEWMSFPKDTFDGLGCSGELACMGISTTSLAPVTQGQAYSETITAVGATDYIFSLAGNTGSGLSIDSSTGEISGVVTAGADINLTITAQDSADPSRSITENLTITVTPTTLAFTTATTLTAGVPNQTYSSVQLGLSFDASVFTFSDDGNLPAGLSLSSSGELTGTPTVAGDYSFTITATHNTDASITVPQTFTLSVSAGYAAITGDAIQNQTLMADTSNIQDSDGNGFTYQWLSEGVAINTATGSSYTLTDADVNTQISLSVSYTNSNGQAETLTSAPTASVTNVNDAPSLTVENQTVIKDVVFSYLPITTDSTNDDTNGYTYTLTGSLPAGLQFDENTGEISGTATGSEGTSSVSISVDDNGEHTAVSSAFDLAVSTAPPAQLLITKYVEGSGSNKLLEITNVGTSVAYTSLITFGRCTNGGCSDDNGSVSGASSIALDPSNVSSLSQGESFVIANGSNTLSTAAVNQTSGSINHNGDDSYILYYNNIIVDAFGDADNDPGAAWTASLNGISYSTQNKTLVRNGCVTTGRTDVFSEFNPSLGWSVFDEDTANNLGTHDTSCVNSAPTGTVSLQLPTEGQYQVGTELVIGNTVADADGIDSNSISYQWYREGVAIVNATNNRYLLTQDDAGSTITVTLSYADGNGTLETSTSVASVAIAQANNLPTGTVTINGLPETGEQLTTSNDIADVDGLSSFSYQWLRDSVAITSATASSYTLTPDDIGSQISVSISYTDGLGTLETLTSAATGAVIASNTAPQISLTPVTQAVVTESFSVTPTATDPDVADTLSFSINIDLSLYSWLSFDTTTGELSGIPSSGDIGQIDNIEITVSDDASTPLTDTSAPFSVNIIPAVPSEGILITEYHETGTNKVIEISNYGSTDVDLFAEGYTLQLYSNENSTVTSSDALVGNLVAGSSLVIYKQGADSAFAPAQPLGFAITSGAMNFNGNDAVVLAKNGTAIDSIGQVGDGAMFAENVTLRRYDNTIADTNLTDGFDAGKWLALAQDTTDGLGCSGVAACTGSEPQPTEGTGSTDNTCLFSSCDQPAKVADRQTYSDSTYYTNALAADATNASAIRTAIHTDITASFTSLTYNEVWMALLETDVDPDNSDNVRLIYKSNSIAKSQNNSVSSSEDSWNREHIWSKSHGFPSQSQAGFTDLHHLVPADKSVNTDRSTKDFDNGGSVVQDNGIDTNNYSTSTTWQPRDETKGDVARMMMYMDIRYEAGSDSDMPDLVLVDTTATSTSNDLQVAAEFGKLCTLYTWHSEDPVDSYELNRNNVIYEYQGNRNPFIDHPEWVAAVYGDACNVVSNTVPTATDSTASVDEDSTVSITPDVVDAEDDSLTYSITTAPTNGTLDTTSLPWSYTPNADFNGTDSIIFVANDGTEDAAAATITITVANVNDTPSISGTPITSVAQNGTYSFTPVASDSDSDILVFSVTGAPSWLNINPMTGELSGTATELEDASSVVLSATDGTETVSLAPFAISVVQSNVAPVADNASLTVDEDTPLSITPTGSDSNGDDMVFTLVSGTANGSLDTSSTPWTYTPTADYNGSDSLTFIANDGELDSATATVSITVTAINDAPEATAQSLTTAEDTDLVINISSVFSDVDGDSLTVTIDSQGQSGSTVLDGASLTYQPNPNYQGADSLVVSASDGELSSQSVTLDITVTAVADAPTISGVPDNTVMVGNDYLFTPVAEDNDGDNLSFSISDISAHTWLSFDTATGTLSGTPTAGTEGVIENIVITVTDDSTDNLSTSIATFSLTVTERLAGMSIVINEFLADPAGDLTGDANSDGIRDGSQDEFVELYNDSDDTVDISGWTLHDGASTSLRHTFADSTLIPARAGYLVFGGGELQTDNNFVAYSGTPAVVASSGSIGLNNSGDTISLYDADNNLITTYAYGSEGGDNQSISRDVLGTGSFVAHSSLGGNILFSPGGQDGVPFAGALVANTVPTSTDSTVSVDEDSTVSITPDVVDAENDSLTYNITTAPTNGTLDTTSLPWSYTPDADFNGTDSIIFVTNDGTEDSAAATITITVANVNDTPSISGNPSTTVALNGPYAFTPLASDIDSDILVFSVTGAPSWLNINPITGELSGTATELEDASSVVLSVDDGAETVSLPPFAISVVQTNVAPVADNASLTVDEDTPLSITPTGSDSNGDSIGFTLVSGPSNGSLDTSSTPWTYTPTADYSGSDSLTFIANDGELDSTIATVSINIAAVNDSPEGQPANVATDEDISLTTELMTVFSDIDSNNLSFIIDQAPANGIASIVGTTLNYQPSADVNGTDTLVITASDGELDSPAIEINITINAINDAPKLTGSAANQAFVGAIYSFTPQATDADGDSLAFNVVGNDAWLSIDPVTGVLSGTPSITDEGELTDVVISVSDGELSQALTPFTITVIDPNVAPVANNQTSSTDEDSIITITPDVSDDNNDELTFVISTAPDNGNVTLENGAWVYTPNTDYNGPDSFTYTVDDGALSNSATVSIDVVSVNDAPSISGQPATSVNAGESYSFVPSAQDDNGSLIYSVSSLPSWAQFDSVTGALSGQPAISDEGSYGDIQVQVTDGELTQSLPPFAITVNVINTAPTASEVALVVDEDQLLSFQLQGQDSEGDSLQVLITRQPNNGSLTVSATGQYVYTPDLNFSGQDSFSYQVSDGELSSGTATVSIDVNGINDAPMASNDILSLEASTDSRYTLDVLANDSDVDSTELSLGLASSNIGTVTVVDDKLLLNTDNAGGGSVLIRYSVLDDEGASSIAYALVDITSAPLANAPVISVPDDIRVASQGLMTQVNLGVATAVDANGELLAVKLLRDDQKFAPGRHLVQWQATDADGQTSTASQTVLVDPIVSISQRAQVSEGGSVNVTISLNGNAVDYPLSIAYEVAGTADSGDHDLRSATVVIASGTQQTITVNTLDDGVSEGTETLTVSLDDELNIDGNNIFTLNIEDNAIAPNVSYQVSQQQRRQGLVVPSKGMVTVDAVITNGDVAENYNYSWFADNSLISNVSDTDAQFVFDPSALTDDIYSVTLDVAPNDNTELTTRINVFFEVKAEQVVLTTADSDGDLIPDELEGLGDSDADGIPDYLDAIDVCHVIQQEAVVSDSFLVQAEPGTCLRKGVTIAGNSSGGVLLTADEVSTQLAEDTEAEIRGGLVDFVLQSLATPGASYPVVIPQLAPIPSAAIYRKYHSSLGWINFEIDSNNSIFSALGSQGQCPSTSDSVWTEGLTEGHWCVKLVIEDGGLNDDDGLANGQIVDPGGVATLKSNNQAPVAVNDIASLRVSEQLLIDVLNNDTDADNHSLTLLSATTETGLVTVENQQLVYVADANFVGDTLIDYIISDGNGGISTAQVEVAIVLNQAPMISDETMYATRGQTVTVNVLQNDKDPENDPLAVTNAVVDSGTVTVSDAGIISYTPSQHTVTASIIYTVSDSLGATEFGTVTVTINQPVIAPPQKRSSGGTFAYVLLLLLIAMTMRRRFQP